MINVGQDNQIHPFNADENMNQRNEQHSCLAEFCILRNRYKRLIHLCSLSILVIVQYSICAKPWLVLYVYSVIYPILLGLRIYNYCVNESSGLFLLDPCYFVNAYTLIVIWIVPYSNAALQVHFGISNGPVLYAILPFRNSLVFHDLDKLTSFFIHHFPPLISFCHRWFNEDISRGWYTPFDNATSVREPFYSWSPGARLELLVGIPAAFLAIHWLLYSIIIRLLINPDSNKYTDSYSYLAAKFCPKKGVIGRLPYRCQLILVHTVVFVSCSLLTLTSWLFYTYFLSHCIIIVMQMVIVVWNGGTYYVEYYRFKASKVPGMDETDNEDADVSGNESNQPKVNQTFVVKSTSPTTNCSPTNKDIQLNNSSATLNGNSALTVHSNSSKAVPNVQTVVTSNFSDSNVVQVAL